MSLAAHLRTLRSERKMTLQEVADALEVSKPHVWELEKGKSKNPSAELLIKLSKLFNTTVDQLLGNTGVNTEEDSRYNPLFRKLDTADLSESELKAVEIAITTAIDTIKASKM